MNTAELEKEIKKMPITTDFLQVSTTISALMATMESVIKMIPLSLRPYFIETTISQLTTILNNIDKK